MPSLERLFLRIDGADAAHFDAHVDDFVDGARGLLNENAKHGRVGAEVMILKRCVEHFLHGRLDAVLLLVLSAYAQGPFGKETRAAEERKLFEHDRLDAHVDELVRGGKAGQAAAHDDDVDLLLHNGGHGGGCRGERGRSGGGAEELTTIELHDDPPLIELQTDGLPVQARHGNAQSRKTPCGLL